MPSRRSYLTTVSALAAGLAGCVGDAGTGSDPAATETISRTASDSPTATEPSPSSTGAAAAAGFDPATVVVYGAAVQHSIRHISNVDWNGIHTVEGKQFVFVGVDATEADRAPDRTAFSLAADGEAIAATDLAQSGHQPYDPAIGGRPYDPRSEYDANRRGWLCFVAPTALDAPPRLRVGDGDAATEREPTGVDAAAAPPPAWEFSASAPESVAPEETFDLEMVATNVGDGAGVFRGAVNFSFPYYYPKGFDVVLEPGESGSTTVRATSEGAKGGDVLEYGVRTPVGRREMRVAVDGDAAGESATAEATRTD